MTQVLQTGSVQFSLMPAETFAGIIKQGRQNLLTCTTPIAHM